ncbi:MAG: sulfite exporter TauE/SafE family protein, partial [Thioalkalivibrio sp.]|nr:sulfite exporter TauE/SafE family protein [Thioalkalivibrio sp.]
LPALLDPERVTPAWSIGYLYLPAIGGIAVGAAFSVRAGVWLAHHLPILALRRAFAGVLMLAGVYMLLR